MVLPVDGLDPRVTPCRPDIAADHLRGVVASRAYVSGQVLTVAKGVADLRKSPMNDAGQLSQMRYGDSFISYESKDGWLWGQCERDGYVGYVRDDGFTQALPAPSHRVIVSQTFIFPDASIKSPPIDVLTFFSAVEVIKASEKFHELKSGGFIHAHHITPVANWRERDLVFNAGRFLNVPYLWGGNTPMGFDCSGLVQLACEVIGVQCPRDSDMQTKSLGVLQPDGCARQRGDLVFFKGHVGIMADQAALLHANAFHGRVTVEPLADVVARGDIITAVRRLA